MKALVAYFSHAGENYGVGTVAEGNTAVLAKMIAQATGGELYEIKTAEAYPAGYKACTEAAKREQQAGARPKLAATLPNVADYDLIFLGYPNWWGEAPMPVYTFVEGLNLAGKKIAPFCTHEGSGLGRTVRGLAAACPGATMLKGLAVQGRVAQQQGTAQRAVEGWLVKLDVSE